MKEFIYAYRKHKITYIELIKNTNINYLLSKYNLEIDSEKVYKNENSYCNDIFIVNLYFNKGAIVTEIKLNITNNINDKLKEYKNKILFKNRYYSIKAFQNEFVYKIENIIRYCKVQYNNFLTYGKFDISYLEKIALDFQTKDSYKLYLYNRKVYKSKLDYKELKNKYNNIEKIIESELEILE